MHSRRRDISSFVNVFLLERLQMTLSAPFDLFFISFFLRELRYKYMYIYVVIILFPRHGPVKKTDSQNSRQLEKI